MKTYQTQIEIDATPACVWKTLTESMPRMPERYGILRLEGEIALGSKIKLWSEVAPKRAFALKVINFDVPKLMVWSGGMPFGLFVGTRKFTITSSENGCTFHISEVFSGLLAGLITKSMPDLIPSFVKFADTLKQEAEQK